MWLALLWPAHLARALALLILVICCLSSGRPSSSCIYTRVGGLPFQAAQRHAVPSEMLSKRPANSAHFKLVRHCHQCHVRVSCPRDSSLGAADHGAGGSRRSCSGFHQSGAWHCPVSVGHALPSAASSSKVSSASSLVCHCRSRSPRSQLARENYFS